MKKNIIGLALSILSIIFLLTGCTCTPEIVKVKESYYTPLPKVMLEGYDIPKPPLREEYLGSNIYEREVLTSTLIVDLYITIGLYKTNLNKIKKIDENLSKIIIKSNIIE